MRRYPPHPVTLRQLQYAIAVAEHGSFHKAAAACAISQPSLSAQIAQVEDVLGVTLFERLPRKVVVTDAGAALLERARVVVRDADDFVASAQTARDPLTATLRIGVIPTVAPYVLPDAAPLLKSSCPKLRVLWSEDKTATLVEQIEQGAIDAGVLALESDLGDLVTERIGRDAFCLVVPKEHPLAKAKGPATPHDLDREAVLLLDDGHCFRDQALAYCARAGADESSVRATSLSTLAQMVAGGAGVTLLPEIAIRAENRAGSFAVRRFGPKGPHRTLVLAWRKSSPSAPALESVAASLRETVARIASAAFTPSVRARAPSLK